MASKKQARFHAFQPSYGGVYWYLGKGRSTIAYKIDDTVIAGKHREDVEAIASILNDVLDGKDRKKWELNRAIAWCMWEN